MLLEPEVEAPSSLSPPMVVNACGMVMDSKAPSCSSMPSTPKPLTFGSNAKMETATSHTPESVSQQPGAASSSEFPSATPPIRDGPKVIKTIKKLLVEVLCSQHNPVSDIVSCVGRPFIRSSRRSSLHKKRWTRTRNYAPTSQLCRR